MATVLLCLLASGRRAAASAITRPGVERIRSLPDLLPPLSIFLMVLGSIYAGWATPTESASLGVLGARFSPPLTAR